MSIFFKFLSKTKLSTSFQYISIKKEENSLKRKHSGNYDQANYKDHSLSDEHDFEFLSIE